VGAAKKKYPSSSTKENLPDDKPLTLKDLRVPDKKKSTQREKSRRNADDGSLEKELRDQQHLLKSFLTNMQSPKSQMNTNRQS
jgi:ribosomal protein L32